VRRRSGHYSKRLAKWQSVIPRSCDS